MSPKWLLDGSTSGSSALGMQQGEQPSSHWLVRTLNSMVRAALLTSVTCTAPWVRFHISQLSTVPKASSPALGANRARRARGPAATAAWCRKIGVHQQPGLGLDGVGMAAARAIVRRRARRAGPARRWRGARAGRSCGSTAPWFRAGW